MSISTDALRSFHLRVLFPHILSLSKTDPRRLNAPPRITRSKPIDSELYTYIALLVRDFIHPWYRVVTNDQDFVAELVRILIIVIRELETRFCEQVDWTELIMISAPNLLSIHYQDYRQAKMRLQMSHAGNAVSLEALFHGTQPHFALRSEEQEMEYLRALTDAILQTVLDPADYNSDCVRHLVRELVANLVLGNIVELLADPYVIHMIICKLLESYDPLVDELEASGQFTSSEDLIMVDDPIDVTDGPEQKQERLASALQEAQATDMSDEQQLSTSSPAAQQQQSTPPLEKEAESLPSHMQRLQEKRRQQGDELVDAGRDELDGAKAHERRHFSFIYITLQVMLAPIQTMWLYLTAILTSSQERYQQVAQHTKRTRHVRLLEPWMHFIRIAFLVDDRPVLQWTWSMVGMFLWPLVRVLGGGLLVDKFLEQTIMHFLGEDQLVFYLQLGRNLLWPDGQFIRKGEPVTAREKEQMRIRAERLLTVCFPGIMGKVVFEAANLDDLQSHIHDAIEPLQNKYINKHLMFLLVDLVASKAIPSLVDDQCK